MSKHAPDVVAAAGVISVWTGVASWSRPAAFIVAGLTLIGVAYLAARREPRTKV